MRRYHLLSYGIIILVVDQIIKFWAKGSPNIIKNINFGIIWTLKPDVVLGLIWIILTLIIILIIIFSKIQLPNQNNLFLPIALILIGALSNLFDRILYGGVIDYLNLKNYIFFNLADVAIILGIIIYVKNLWIPPKKFNFSSLFFRHIER
jgi:signal peptidase II